MADTATPTTRRVITRLWCSRTHKQHMLGTVVAGAQGLTLRYKAAVYTTPADPRAVQSPQDGLYYRREPFDAELALSRTDDAQVDLWCKDCKTAHPFDAIYAFHMARMGQRSIQLASRGWSDGRFGKWPTVV